MSEKKTESAYELCRNGDELTNLQFFVEKLYIEYKGYLNYIIKDSLYNKQEKEEIIQEVFVVAVSNYDKIKSYVDIKSWLAVTAQNLVYSSNRKYRKRSSHLEYNFELLNGKLVNYDFVEDIRYRDYIRRNVMGVIFQRLSKKDLLLYEMKYRQNKTIEEIAKYFMVNKKCISTRLWRLKIRVGRYIDEFGMENKL